MAYILQRVGMVLTGADAVVEKQHGSVAVNKKLGMAALAICASVVCRGH
jgi:translation initiation factor 2B subunit (eIF-2B alpha/beta/delta family)